MLQNVKYKNPLGPIVHTSDQAVLVSANIEDCPPANLIRAAKIGPQLGEGLPLGLSGRMEPV